MSVIVHGMKGLLQRGYQVDAIQIGKWNNHMVKIIKEVFAYIQKNRFAVEASTVIMNIIFVEIAIRITRVSYCAINCYSKQHKKNYEKYLLPSIVVGLCFVLIRLNFVFYRGLQSHLSPSFTGIIAVASCINYLVIRGLATGTLPLKFLV